MTAHGDAHDTLVILPTYNERDTLADIVSRLLAESPEIDVLIVDDASPDGTGAIADELAAADTRVRVQHRPGKLGLGTAYIAGFRTAVERGYRYAVEMDSDGSHLPEELPHLLEAAHAGAGLVIGARWIAGGQIRGWPLHRRLISRTGTAVARLALRSRLHDITSGFRVIDTEWLRRIDFDEVTSQGYGFQVEVAWILERADCAIAEVPITFVERTGGSSKMSFGIVVEALSGVLRWGFDLRFRPHRLQRPHELR